MTYNLRIAIVQSCYIPWKGFFDLIGLCDEYVIFDSVQYAKRHWHNRNRIKTQAGPQWLTIPVATKGRFQQSIDSVEIEGSWAEKHWRSVELAYGRAPYFQVHAGSIKALYERASAMSLLTDVNEVFLREISQMLGLATKITRDTRYPIEGRKTERLLTIARAAGAHRYLSGPSARDYLEEDLLERSGITTEWMSYSGYDEYPQLHGPFEHSVSVLDVIFNTGPDAPSLVRGSTGSRLQTQRCSYS